MVFTIASCLCLLSRVAQVGLLAMGPEQLGASGSLVMLSDERGFSKIQSGGVYRWEMTATLAAKPGKSVEHTRRLLTRQSGDWRSRGGACAYGNRQTKFCVGGARCRAVSAPGGLLYCKLVVSSAGEAYDAQGERSRSEIPVTCGPTRAGGGLHANRVILSLEVTPCLTN